MAKKFQLSIPEPCHENWDAMTPVEQGKFCGSCQKQVVDFSTMSDRQVAEFFKKPSTGSVCGRFMTDQLERDIEIPKKRIPWAKYFFQFVLPAFFTSIKASSQTSPKEEIIVSSSDQKKFKEKMQMAGNVKRIELTISKPVIGDTIIMPEIVVVGQIPFKPSFNNSFLTSKVAGPVVTVESTTPTTSDIASKRDLSLPTSLNLSDKLSGRVGGVIITKIYNRTILGVVTDEKGNPVIGATVVIKGTKVGTGADNNGNFRILAKTGDVLLAVSAGYESAEITVGNGNTISLVMRPIVVTGYTVVVGGISVSYDRPKKNKPKKEIVAEEITGKVMDEKGNPIPGAAVVIKGTKSGVVTQNDGSFTIKPAKVWERITLISVARDFEAAEKIVTKGSNTDSVVIQMITTPPSKIIECIIYKKSNKKKESKKLSVIPEIKQADISPFKVFPNPVEAGTNLNIEWNNAEEGYYTMQLLNQSGQSVQQQEVWIDADVKLLSIDIPEVAAGNYFVVMTNKKTGKKFTEKIIVQ